MSNDKMHEEFEAWASENGMARHLVRAESGLYVSRATQNYMDCWMASSAEQAAKVEVLTSQVQTLQSDANSYQSGYDAGRAAAKAHADSWRAEAEKLRTALTANATFLLKSPLIATDRKLPGRQVVANCCQWLVIGGYRGPYCAYTGSAYFTDKDQPTDDPARDMCSGTLTGCKLRFGANNPLRYGSFPSAGY